jgi:membrane protein DedA with SNARE-associated domain
VPGLLDWLAALPPAVLYLVMGTFAAIENVFPPVPADTVVAFGSWLAARGQGSALGAFLATWIGNVGGAAGMYWVGRRHGTGWLRRRFPSLVGDGREERLEAMYARYGVLALVLSRFLPGLRALVPPLAGALRISPLAAVGATGAASAVWYGAVSYLAYTAGADWEQLSRAVAHSGRIAALAVVVVAAIGAVLVGRAWHARRRRSVGSAG